MSKRTQRQVKKTVKRMRKSSFNRVQKDFEIFHDTVDHFNNYECLTLDIADPEFEEDPNDGRNDIYLVDTDIKKQREIPEVIEIDDDKEETEDSMSNDIIQDNALELNRDFIAFSDDSSSDSEQDVKIQPKLKLKSKTTKLTYSEELESERSQNTEFPWLLNHDHSKQKDISKWLTLEIQDFISFISPSKQEIETRNHTIKKLRHAVRQCWSDATIHVFGSYATDLYLPGSDIDCVITSKTGDKEHRSYLYELARYLKNNNIATQIEVIAKARVPIIKFVDIESQLHIDLSFERLNGIEVAKIIRNWLDNTPGLRELVLVVKQFLKSRRLNDVHTGGLGGLSIVCLIYSFLYLHPKLRTDEIEPMENLGVLLMDFFELYGKNFAYDNVALSFEDDIPTYMPKSHWRALLPSRSSFALAIQDPLDPSNNLSRGSFNIASIKKAFSGAFDLLSNKCFELNEATFKDRIGRSILGNVIKYKGEARHFKDERELVENRAILENEVFHMKRSRTQLEVDDTFLDPSDDDVLTGGQNELEMYRISEPPKKKHKKTKKSMGTVKPHVKPKSKHTPKSIDQLMGISDDNSNDQGDDNNITNPKSNDKKPETQQLLKRATVDAQTKRDYWLSKGQTLASTAIPKKNF